MNVNRTRQNKEAMRLTHFCHALFKMCAMLYVSDGRHTPGANQSAKYILTAQFDPIMSRPTHHGARMNLGYLGLY